MNKEQLKLIVQKTLPYPIHHWLTTQLQAYKHHPPVGRVNFGDLGRLQPISRNWNGRGQPIDRYYIEKFLSRNSDDIRQRVLEVADNNYSRKWGGEKVTKSDILNVIEGNPYATIVGDLVDAPQIASNSFDCIILTQVLQYIYDIQSALKTIHRILKPGGVVLATLPNITPLLDPDDNDESWGTSCWCWNFTKISAQQLFEEVFPKENIQVETHGNALAATAFLQGLAVQDIPKGKLDYHDRSYEVTITVRAVKPDMR
ncbi:Methyltransferase type 11 [Nostoc sp. DSM 114160]|jgi:SAM-dependent methyltransferase